jgi:hypothetical protein
MRDHAVHGLHDDDHDVQRNGECESTPVARDGGMVVMVVAMAMAMAVSVALALARMCGRIMVVVRVRFMVMIMVVAMIIAVLRGMRAMSTPLRRGFLVVWPNGRVLVVALFGGTLWFAIVAHQTDS